MAYRMKMTAAEKAEQAKQRQQQRNQNKANFRKSRDEKKTTAKARREAAQEQARQNREKMEARRRARDEQRGYERASSRMAREMAGNEKPGFEGRANRFLDKATDNIGDAIRSGGRAIGIESDFDTGAMRARKEIKGYKKGGKVKAKKASKPKVRGAGKVMKGVRPAKMVKMKGA